MADHETWEKSYYLDIWSEMLGAFLGWSTARVAQWVQATDAWKWLDDPNGLIYHQTPQYWITSLLIPDALKSRLSGQERVRLQHRLVAAFKDEHHYRFPRGTNWQPYRDEMNRILAEYNERLPDPVSS